jgi:hypothetical protein
MVMVYHPDKMRKQASLSNAMIADRPQHLSHQFYHGTPFDSCPKSVPQKRRIWRLEIAADSSSENGRRALR